MVGSWNFDNNTFDSSGRANHGTMHNFPANPWVDGVVGNALSFNGVNSFVSVPHTDSLDRAAFGITKIFTLEVWAHPRTWVDWTAIINKADRGCWWDTTNGIWASLEGFSCVMGSGPDPTCNPSGGGIRVSYIPSLNQWHHISCTANGNNLVMFVNGREVGRTAIGNITHRRDQSISPLVFGQRCVGCGPSFNGNIDEVRIFRAAMPTSYIQKRYVEGVKSLAANNGITQEEKQQRIAQFKNSGQLVIDLSAALAGPIDFSPYAHYLESLALESTE